MTPYACRRDSRAVRACKWSWRWRLRPPHRQPQRTRRARSRRSRGAHGPFGIAKRLARVRERRLASPQDAPEVVPRDMLTQARDIVRGQVGRRTHVLVSVLVLDVDDSAQARGGVTEVEGVGGAAFEAESAHAAN